MSNEQKKKLSEYFTGRPNPRKNGTKTSPETLKKMSECRKGKPNLKIRGIPHSEETKIKMSLAKKGKCPPNKGKPMSQSQKELLSKIHTGRPSKLKGRKFEGTDEERKIKFGSHNIGNTYNKGRKHKEGYGEAITNRSLGVPNIKLYKPILQYTLDGEFVKEFDSIKNASKETGLSAWTIGYIAKGKMKVLDKFIFKFKRA